MCYVIVVALCLKIYDSSNRIGFTGFLMSFRRRHVVLETRFFQTGDYFLTGIFFS